eukprot:6099842-Pyramimonas_sp.AAC.2
MILSRVSRSIYLWPSATMVSNKQQDDYFNATFGISSTTATDLNPTLPRDVARLDGASLDN